MDGNAVVEQMKVPVRPALDVLKPDVDLLITLKRKGEALDELDKLVKMGVHRGSLLDLYSRARKIK